MICWVALKTQQLCYHTSMHFVADLHLHSRYSRAVSQRMILPEMAKWGQTKGIDMLTTADWTHPLWFKEIKTQLEEAGEGLYKLKNQFLLEHGQEHEKFRFLLTTEVACIYSQGGKGRRVHNLLFSPSLLVSEQINKALMNRGANLMSDGRPILGISSRDLLEMMLEIDERCMLIPAHIWTPWFSVFGSKSGFDTIEECFGDLSSYIYGIETGLSSDPIMNWRVNELDTRSILSFSDSHSLMKMGREATVFDIPKDNDSVSFQDIREAIMRPATKKGKSRVAYTIEFYPEEGKYHYTGHRKCDVIYTPEDTKAKGTICPVCKQGLTVGVMEQVEALADTPGKDNVKMSPLGIKWNTDPRGIHPPYVNLVQLIEIVAETVGTSTFAQKAVTLYETLCRELGSELTILLKTPIEDIARVGGERLAEGVRKVRGGDIAISPGFDGEYGIVKIWDENGGTTDSVQNVENKEEEKKVQIGIKF